MTREKAREASEIMKAYADGKGLQILRMGVWENCDIPPLFNWNNCDYRIKPELKYIPFTYEDREQLRDKWIKHRDGGSPNKREHVITGIDIDGITTQTDRFSYAQLLEFMIFTDESPCGKVVE